MLLKKIIIWIVTVIFVVLFASAVYSLHQSPSFDARFQWNKSQSLWQVVSVPSKTELQKNDELLFINRQPVTRLHLLQDNNFITDRTELFEWFDTKRVLFDTVSTSPVEIQV